VGKSYFFPQEGQVMGPSDFSLPKLHSSTPLPQGMNMQTILLNLYKYKFMDTEGAGMTVHIVEV